MRQTSLFDLQHYYFNTTNKTDEDLQISTGKTERQQDKILNFYALNKNRGFTVYEVWSMLYNEQGILKTSVGRAITNLFNSGKLEKREKIKERYGVENFRYYFNKN